MEPMMMRTGHHSSAARRGKRGAVRGGSKKRRSVATMISILSVFSCLHEASKKRFMALRAREVKIALAAVMSMGRIWVYGTPNQYLSNCTTALAI